jgi:glutaredoxin
MRKGGDMTYKVLPSIALLLLFCAPNSQAELYKWIGPNGKVTYSDMPPPESSKQAKLPSFNASGSGTDGLPYELAEAVKNNPVILYTTTQCIPCDQGRSLLKNRGIPYAEKTVNSNDDIGKLRQISGDAQLPVLTIGSNKQRGFESAAWNNALTAAGYPESSRLPKGYLGTPAESASPVAKSSPVNKPDTTQTSPEPGSEQLRPATGNTPSGFRF